LLKAGAYGAGLQVLIDEGIWSDESDLADAYLGWGPMGYGAAPEGKGTRFARTATRSADA